MVRFAPALVVCALVAQTAAAQLPPAAALKSMQPGDGLQVQLFAAEPMVINPTAMDIDHKGRVWVTEAVNYRRKNFNRPILRPEGDRIQILIDETGEGKATKAVTFYQGVELYGPLSVCVLPQPDGKALRVLVAQSPDILEFWDRDGDLKADGPPTKFLSGFQGFDHDHGVHGLTTGPDGKLYFTVGDSGVKDLHSRDGKGPKYTSNTTDCRAGTVWRCDLDGNNLELVAHNFRNNYEACVDSFGEIWLSDNDDDGNQQTRICHVMPGGNYGYHPRGPGQTHWHEEQPGIVHKTLRTGFGSPTGICFYEGDLLKKFTGDLLHCDAGPREVRAFHRKPKGAGYELDKTVILTSPDTWFRPSDVTVAPDGSVFVCDWYDPGVGGHGMGDWKMGRVYRLTPAGHAGYRVPEVKLDTKAGTLAAMSSPNAVVRTMAIAQNNSLPDPDAIERGVNYLGVADRFVQARGVWAVDRALTKSGASLDEKYRGDFTRFIQARARDADFLALLPRAFSNFPTPKIGAFKSEAIPSELVATVREALILLRGRDVETAKQYVLAFAKLYDGQDITYRAALNIACGTDPARRDAILADFATQFPEWNDKVADLVWELRPKSMLPKLGTLVADAKLTAAQKARVVDILAASDDTAAGRTMLGLLTADQPAEVKARAIESLRLFLPTKWNGLAATDDLRTAVSGLLANEKTRLTGLQLVAAAKFTAGRAEVAAIATDAKQDSATRVEAIRTLGPLRSADSLAALVEISRTEKAFAVEAVRAIGLMLPGGGKADAVGQQALDVLKKAVAAPAATDELRGAALAALAGNRAGTQWLLEAKQGNQLPESLVADAGRLLRNSPFQGERNKAMILFPAPGKLDPKKLPAPAVLAKRTGNAANGAKLMAASLTGESQCMKCHMVRGAGGKIGPDLSQIGKKGSRENLFESILNPSKAIADQFASWKLETEDGQTITGLIVQETETTFTVRDANGKDYSFPVKGTDRKKSLVSLMPEGLVATLTEDELVDIVEYMTTLQTPALTPDAWQHAGPFPVKDAGGLDAKHDAGTKWNVVRPGAGGYVDLAAAGGPAAVDSVSYLKIVVDSPVAQAAEILLGTDDGCRLFVNDESVFGHDRAEAATPARDVVKVKLRAGANTILLKIANGSNPHGFYFTLLSGQDVKAK